MPRWQELRARLAPVDAGRFVVQPRHPLLHKPLCPRIHEACAVDDATAQMTLRACLKRSRSGCKTPHHQVDHGDPYPRLSRCGQGLKVFPQPTRAMKPAKGACADPAPLHHLKALRGPRAFHDHEGPLEHCRAPGDERASVAASSPEQLQPREASAQRRQDRLGPITILETGRMPHDDEEQPEDIDHAVALAAADALPPLRAPAPPFAVVFTV
jgi:hypothetical protein